MTVTLSAELRGDRMIGWGASAVSETASFIVVISLSAIAIASEIWEWIAWLRW